MERQKSNDSIIPKCRYYGVFAVNKNDPTDIRGYVYTGGGTGWSKFFVKAFQARTKKAFEKYIKTIYCKKEFAYSDSQFMDFFKNVYPDKYQEDMTPEQARQIHYNKWYDILKHEWVAQDVLNYIRSCPFDVPVGYELKIWRLNSTKLPVMVDLRYRTACDETDKVPYDKWCYRNAAFWVKACNPDQNLKGPYIYFNWPKSVYIGPTERVYFSTISAKRRSEFEKQEKRKPKIFSRTDYKRIKKQQANKLIAEKGSLKEVGT